MPQTARHYCERCCRNVVALTPHWAWRVASPAALAFFIALAFLAEASGLGIAMAGVLVFMIGGAVVGPVNEQATRSPLCPDCRCAVVRRSRITERARALAASSLQPSD